MIRPTIPKIFLFISPAAALADHESPTEEKLTEDNSPTLTGRLKHPLLLFYRMGVHFFSRLAIQNAIAWTIFWDLTVKAVPLNLIATARGQLAPWQ